MPLLHPLFALSNLPGCVIIDVKINNIPLRARVTPQGTPNKVFPLYSIVMGIPNPHVTDTSIGTTVREVPGADPILLVPEFIPLEYHRMGRYEDLPDYGIPMLFGPTVIEIV
ncbi:unnamed protein product [Bursaphelenchus xylophilus]|uniref:(pine wood nematode) hypothetical protein n=1 Tax=Bursaphelenchus xylophilus TaxID=6326 RepID=A0A1I7RUL4_BURXY|nr:unnamed protein product [Bursaphelenchus xylophilus]CAG9114203.1 unnamed protein product [Bursaphelenchus xylophilus]